MKKNDVTDLRSKTVDELSRILLDLGSEVEKNKTQEALGKAKNSNAARSKKKDVARVMTFLSMKQIETGNLVIETEGGTK